MDRFQEHPDGSAIIENGAFLYIDTLANFHADIATTGLPAYPGSGTGSELYRPGIVHCSYANDSQLPPTVDPALCQRYFTDIHLLLTAQTNREALEALQEK